MPRRTVTTQKKIWRKALAPDELPDGRVKAVSCDRQTVCMTRHNGKYAALDNRCPHQGGPLGERSIENGLLRCPWHGWDFDPVSGKPPGFALEATTDYIILDGRGGGTGAAPNIFKNNISVPTIAALARARRHLDERKSNATLIITGGLRTESDFVKALALGADGVALANSALQAIGCLGMRACHTNNCPVGIATQRKDLRSRLIVEQSALKLETYLRSTVELMTILARACGHDRLSSLSARDLSSWKREAADLADVRYAGQRD